MTKKILSLVLAAVMLAGMTVSPAFATDNNRTYDEFCQACQQTRTWYPLAAAADPMTNGHYFQAFGGASLTFGRKILTKDSVVCLLLENKKYVGNRHMILESGATLNIQGPGTVSGRGEDTSAYGTYGDDGAALRILEGATCNMYGGVMTYEPNASRTINYGGAVSVHGVMNLYDGQIKDGVANLAGGTAYVGATGVMNLYGGSVTGGTITGTDGATAASSCVYNSGRILFANDVTVDSVYLSPVSGGPALSEMLTFRDFTGSVALYFDDAVTLTDGMVLGTVSGTLSENAVVLPDTGFKVVEKEGKLLAKWPEPVGNTTAGTEHASLEAAVEAAKPGDVLTLNRDLEGDQTVNKCVILDLDGHSIHGTVTATQGQVLYVRDTQTADYDITDGKYGTIAKTEGAVYPAPATASTDAYVTHADAGGISYHAVRMELTAISLRPGSASLYYTAEFDADTLAAQQVESWGVALSVTAAPTAENMDSDCEYTKQTGEFGVSYSCLLRNILSQSKNDAENGANAQIPVYSSAYIQLTGGEKVMGVARKCSLQDVVETVDSAWDTLPYSKKSGVLTMYDNFTKVLNSWSIPNVLAALGEEDKVMKILSIGQSHSQDSIWLLQEVLQTEMPDKEFLVAECIRSVTMVDHVANANSDNAIYTYYVNTDGAWVANENWTIRQALKDQRWDYIVINESSRLLGLESVMKKGYVQQMADFVNANITYDYKLLYNWTWTTPTDQTFHDENFDPQPSATFWSNYVKDYQADRTVHYESMRAMLEKYVEPMEDIDMILYSATPIQYATEVLGVPQAEVTDPDLTKLPFSLADYSLYRDYIHLSDYGRLYIAYLWYAQLYGLESIDQVNVDVIEAHLRQWRWVGQGDVQVTQQMKDWIIASVNYTLQHPKEMPAK